MAPTQQQNTESTCQNNSNSDVISTGASSLSSSVKSTSSSIIKSSSSFSNSSSSSINSSSSIKDNIPFNNSTGTPVDWPTLQQGSLLPIATRGLFHSDSFFQDARRDFDQAVKEVLDQWGHRSGSTDDLISYRKLRESDLQDKNQAISITETDSEHKVVLDVRDFMRGDVKVKMIDEDELVVEGIVERQDGGSVSKKTFRRSFTFPGLIKAEKVSSAMSSDGVLTVRVPKNKQIQTSAEKEHSSAIRQSCSRSTSSFSNNNDSITSGRNQSVDSNTSHDLHLPILEKGLFSQDSFFENARKDFEKSLQESLSQWGKTFSDRLEDNLTTYRSLRETDTKRESQATSVTENETHHKVVLDVQNFLKGDVKVKIVNENELKVEGKTEKKDGSSSHKSFSRSFTFPGLIKSEEVTSAMSSDGILTITVPKQTVQRKNLEASSSSISSSSEKQTTAKKVSFDTKGNKSNAESLLKENDAFESILPVSEKGLFFHDDFFASAREDFERAVKQVLESQEKRSASFLDNMTSYRNLREKDLREDNQAVSVSEDHQCHKVVMDVKDFMQNDLKVKIIDENELVVEGKMEKKDNGSVSTRNFCRRFVFPGLVNSEAVSSTMSSDGVLIITVPKKHNERDSSKVTLSETKSKSESISKNASGQLSNCSSSRHFFNESTKNLTQSSDLHSLSSESGNEKISMENLLVPQSMSNFHDDFFERAHEEFESATKRVFNHCNELEPRKDWDIFEGINEKENRTFSMSEDDHQHIVKIDVRDFTGGDLKVKALEQNELLVEGQLDKDVEGGRTSNKSFSRRVKLPGDIRVDAITSVLSKDGTLVITVPKELHQSTGSNSNQTSVESHKTNSHVSSTKENFSQSTKLTSGSASSSYSRISTTQSLTC